MQEEFTLTHGRISLFILFRLSEDWIGPFTLEKTIFFTLSIDLNIILIQKHPHIHSQDNV